MEEIIQIPERQIQGTLIFIDSNVYLRFYDSNQPNFKVLLKTLIQLKSNIFITRQIVDEITRNKAQIFHSTFFLYIKQASESFSNITLPEHLDFDDISKIKEWNKRRISHKKDNDELVSDLKQIYTETMLDIISSKDIVSKQLEMISSNAIKETPQQYENAKRRKDIGNPPGKNSDTLGDQINWEQLLHSVNSIDKLLIVSNDHDYFVQVNNDYHLNPVLITEVLKVNPEIKVFCFNKLSSALKKIEVDMKEYKVVLPKTDIINKIVIEENLSDDSDYNRQLKIDRHFYDESARLSYMFSHNILTKDALTVRLRELGVKENKIDEMIIKGNFTYEDLI